jgi:hypothetical protein
MANTNSSLRKSRKPRAWLYENGEKKPLIVEKPTRLSAYGIWRRKNPVAVGMTKEELRAALK